MRKSINEVVDIINKEERIGLMGHIIAGYPDYNISLEAAFGICDGGADLLEVQFPFSDPTADGPTIEGACYQAIDNGFNIDDGFKLVKELVDNTSTSILIMTYGNIIFKYGMKKFVKKAVEVGAAGLIIPDIPMDDDEGLNTLCSKNNISNILIAAPGADEERIKKLSNTGSGFLYTVARRGITGKKSDITGETKDWLSLVKQNSSLPVAVGFGIQSADQVKLLKDYCTIAVVGSHFVKIIRELYKNKKAVRVGMKDAARALIG